MDFISDGLEDDENNHGRDEEAEAFQRVAGVFTTSEPIIRLSCSLHSPTILRYQADQDIR
jgi:hypothetical protein